MKRYRSILFLLFLLGFVLWGGLISVAASNAQETPVLRLVTSPQIGEIGDEFVTEIYADHVPSPGLGSWQARIEFSQIVLDIDTVQFGDDLFNTGRPKLFELSNTNTPGVVLLAQSSLPPGDGPIGSDILLATIHWRATGSGATPLRLFPNDSQRLVDVDGNSFSSLVLVDNHIFVKDGFPYHSCLPLLMASRE